MTPTENLAPRPSRLLRSFQVEQIEFQSVTVVARNDKEILNDVSFVVPQASIVAVLGASGAGKSTLLQLLPRLREPSRGRICINGIDTATVGLADLRRQIAIVSNNTYLFDGTILENIRFGRQGATMDEVFESAAVARVDEFVREFPHDYATKVGPRGMRLSEGQRQRIALARAILKDPQILILDEATSAVDSDSEERIWEVLEKFVVGRTTFVVSHRLSSVLRADIALILQEGKLVTAGSYEDIAKTAIYSRLYQSQMNLRGPKGVVC
jgi:subfamily B ATP-binding cassette protein MsbA